MPYAIRDGRELKVRLEDNKIVYADARILICSVHQQAAPFQVVSAHGLTYKYKDEAIKWWKHFEQVWMAYVNTNLTVILCIDANASPCRDASSGVGGIAVRECRSRSNSLGDCFSKFLADTELLLPQTCEGTADPLANR